MRFSHGNEGQVTSKPKIRNINDIQYILVSYANVEWLSWVQYSKYKNLNQIINRMSAVLKFITIIEKILIVLCILCFIPTSVFVFAPRDHSFTELEIARYKHAYGQVYTPFIIGYNANSCTFREALLNNGYCFARANANNFRVMFNTSGCSGYSYEYDGVLFCSGLTQEQGGIIHNSFQVLSNSTANFVHTDNGYPIYTVSPPFTSPDIAYYHYRPDSANEYCKFLASELTSDIQTKISKQYYQPYQSSSRLLWYSILPILAFLIAMIIANEVSNKFNLRKYIIMSCLAVNVALIALIIQGIAHFSAGQKIKAEIFLFSGCFVKQQAANLVNMSNIDFGIGFGFLFFMGIVMLLIFLSLAGQLVAKILEHKYYKVRQQPSQGDMQLSDLKQSLRSRRIKTSEMSQLKKKSMNSFKQDEF